MIALVLAAGCGRRMSPMTLDIHKTMIDIGGRTVIDRLLDALLANGIRRVVVVTGYRASEVRGHLEARRGTFDVEFVHNERWAETNNVVSVALALEQAHIDDDVLLVESDLVLDASALARLLASPHPDVALVDRFRPGMDGTVLELEGDVVRAVLPPHLQGEGSRMASAYKTVNVYKLSLRFCQGAFKQLVTWYSRTIDANCYYEAILGILVAGRTERMHAVVLDGEPWCEIDDPVDLDQARFLFDPSSRARMLESAKGGLWLHQVLDFCWLRNMHFPTPSAWAELRNSLPVVLTSYGSSQETLDRKMAFWLGCRPERVVALNGASAAYPAFARWWREVPALRPDPTFGEYARCFPSAVTYGDSPGFDLDALPERVPPGGVVILVTPNNPTGTHVSAAQAHALARRWADRTFLIDTSFAAFAADDERLVTLLERAPLENVIVLESLSKSLGVPGLRLGWLYASDRAVTARLRLEQPVWAMNALAERFLEMLLKRREEVGTSLARTRADREHLASTLGALPGVARVVRGQGNFLLLRLCGDAVCAGALADALLTRAAIYIKDASAKMADGAGWLRVAVRTPEDHARLAAAWTLCAPADDLH